MRRLFQALSKTSEGAFIINNENQIIFWNRAAERILGYTAEEAADRHCFEILGGRDTHGRTLCQRFCRIAICASQGDALPNIDVFARTRDGKGRWINVTTFTFATGNRNFGNVIVHLFRDATQQKINERFIEEIEEASKKLQEIEKHRPLSMPQTAPAFKDLTPREQEVLHLLAHGLSTKEMADSLSISPSTTRNHIQSILNKLDVHSRLEAVSYAYQHGLINISD